MAANIRGDCIEHPAGSRPLTETYSRILNVIIFSSANSALAPRADILLQHNIRRNGPEADPGPVEIRALICINAARLR